MDYEKLKSGVIPLLASPQAGVAASSIKCRAAIAADAAGVVFLLFSIGKPPRPRVSGGFATLLLIAVIDRSATPPCGDARRGIHRSETWSSGFERCRFNV